MQLQQSQQVAYVCTHTVSDTSNTRSPCPFGRHMPDNWNNKYSMKISIDRIGGCLICCPSPLSSSLLHRDFWCRCRNRGFGGVWAWSPAHVLRECWGDPGLQVWEVGFSRRFPAHGRGTHSQLRVVSQRAASHAPAQPSHKKAIAAGDDVVRYAQPAVEGGACDALEECGAFLLACIICSGILRNNVVGGSCPTRIWRCSAEPAQAHCLS